jgi:hypothetical protein
MPPGTQGSTTIPATPGFASFEDVVAAARPTLRGCKSWRARHLVADAAKTDHHIITAIADGCASGFAAPDPMR